MGHAGDAAGRVAGKVALITGAARGQGRSHAVTLAREGADIIALDICGPVGSITGYPPATPADLAETARLIEAHDRRVVTRQVDVRDRRELTAAVDEGVAELGRLDIVVANAGVVAPGADAPLMSFIDTIAVNLGGVVNCVGAALPHLTSGASIIAIGSFAALVGNARAANPDTGPGLVGYTHAKRAVARLVHDLAFQLGPHGIRANAIHPGNVETNMLLFDDLYRVFRPDLESPTREDAESVIRGMHRLPVTYIQPSDISDAVLFLASEESRWITGMQLKVEAGGLLASTTSGVPG
jgi:SDR family mycofactocin-dependent oxidoreductase